MLTGEKEMDDFKLLRSDRKTLALQITPDGKLLVRAPRRMPLWQIRKFMEEKRSWIAAHRSAAQSAFREGQAHPLSERELDDLKSRAKDYFTARTAFFAEKMGVSYGAISIRCQATRWGSCSASGNLSFNCLLMLAPEEVADYVIVHELSHRIQMNHSPAFWAQVSQVLPDYRAQRQWLKEQGGTLLSRRKG